MSVDVGETAAAGDIIVIMLKAIRILELILTKCCSKPVVFFSSTHNPWMEGL